MINITKNLVGLLSPKELADKKILSVATQWKERKEGKLGFYRIGSKVLYSPKHIEDYFDKNENADPPAPRAGRPRGEK